MTTSVDTKAQDAGAADTVKLVAAILLVIGGVAGYYVLENQPVWMRWLAVAVVVDARRNREADGRRRNKDDDEARRGLAVRIPRCRHRISDI